MIIEDLEIRRSFMDTLEWLLALSLRYDSPIQFGLVHIDFGDRNELGEAYGAQEAAKELAELTGHLKSVFRKTDLIARNGTDFWMILPYTPATEKLYDKVIETLGAVDHDGLKVVNPEISVFDLPEHLSALQQQIETLGAPELLAYLKANRQSLARHTFCLDFAHAQHAAKTVSID